MGGQTSSVPSNQNLNESVKPPADAQHSNVKGSIDQCPHFQKQPTEQKTTYPSECPMSGAASTSDINPLNMMPPANQMPAPDQPFSLSTTRVTSNIPKVSDKNENWVNYFLFLLQKMVKRKFLSGLSITTNVLECDVT